MFKFNIKLLLNITWSKAIALIILIMAFVLDLVSKTEGKIFIFSIPWIVILITGKQYYSMRKQIVDWKKDENKNS